MLLGVGYMWKLAVSTRKKLFCGERHSNLFDRRFQLSALYRGAFSPLAGCRVRCRGLLEFASYLSTHVKNSVRKHAALELIRGCALFCV